MHASCNRLYSQLCNGFAPPYYSLRLSPKIIRSLAWDVYGCQANGTFVLLRRLRPQEPNGTWAASSPIQKAVVMISHCANPDCKVPFHYLRGGRLYRFDIRRPSTPCNDVPNAVCSLKPSHAAVFFWLCERCSLKHSLKFNFREGVTLASLPNAVQRHGTAPVVAVREATSIQVFSSGHPGLEFGVPQRRGLEDDGFSDVAAG